MIVVAPFCEVDAELIVPQPAQAKAFAMMGGAAGLCALAARGQAWSIFDRSLPRVIFTGGIAFGHADYATCWAVMADDIGAGMVTVTRRARAEIAAVWHRVNRIDMMVSASHAEGERWAVLLGFRKEAVLGMAMPGGDNALIYARVKGRQDG